MKRLATSLFRFLLKNRQRLFLICCTLLIFAVLAPLAIEQKGFWARSWLTVSAFIGGGAVAGGALGLLVGGIGIAAMGTAVGIPGVAVMGVGALFGGALFGGVGSGLMMILKNPSHFNYNFALLAVILLASMFLARGVVKLISKISWARELVAKRAY